ncbi:MAG: outer membrane beta-barrel protein [Elusimicrobiaceae bacterium]|nr:outer membrane beta-barrel protein [Elusimicrobiaceae bacterium]
MKKLIVLILAAFVALPALAKPVHFMISEDVSYDDNIYLTNKDTQDSVISSTRVGAQYKTNIPGSGLKLTADGMVGYNAYTENASKNNYWDGLAHLDLANDNLKLGDKFIFTSDPINNADTERAKRLENTGYLSWQSSTEKTFGVGINLSDIYNHYMDDAWEDLNRNRFNAGAQLNYNVSPKTKFFLEYMFSDITYDDYTTNNSRSDMFALGVNGQLTPTVTGTAKATYSMRRYNHDLSGAKNYADLVGYYAELVWKPTRNDKVRLSGERRLEETIYGPNRYYVDTNVSLYAGHKFWDKWTASVTLAYDNMAYPKGDQRKDDYYSVRPELDYQFKDWLSAGVWYNFTTRHSTISDVKYDRNRGGVFVRAMF